MAREPTLGELADDVVDLRREVRMLSDAVGRDFVRADLHNEQIGNIRSDLAGLRQSQTEGFSGLNSKFMWVVGILGMILVAVVVAAVTNAMGGAG